MAARGTAEWRGDLFGGAGTFAAGDTGIGGEFTFHSRFQDGPGANPEQLIAAAAAACFCMDLANTLAQRGTPAESIRAEAIVSVGPIDDVPSITRIDLRATGRVHGADPAAFADLAERIGRTCIVSRALAGVPERTVRATLED